MGISQQYVKQNKLNKMSFFKILAIDVSDYDINSRIAVESCRNLFISIVKSRWDILFLYECFLIFAYVRINQSNADDQNKVE